MAAVKRPPLWWASESGAELIEFALTFPLLVIVMLGIIDMGLLFQRYEVVTTAAREGARVAVLPDYSAADVRTRVAQYVSAGIVGTAAFTTTVGAPQLVNIGGQCMATITVNVSYPHSFLYLGGIGTYFGSTFGTKTLSASSTMRVEGASGGC